jgi:hypothetical protein
MFRTHHIRRACQLSSSVVTNTNPLADGDGARRAQSMRPCLSSCSLPCLRFQPAIVRAMAEGANWLGLQRWTQTDSVAIRRLFWLNCPLDRRGCLAGSLWSIAFDMFCVLLLLCFAGQPVHLWYTTSLFFANRLWGLRLRARATRGREGKAPTPERVGNNL